MNFDLTASALPILHSLHILWLLHLLVLRLSIGLLVHLLWLRLLYVLYRSCCRRRIHLLLLLLMLLVELHKLLGWLVKALATWRVEVELSLRIFAHDPSTQCKFLCCLLCCRLCLQLLLLQLLLLQLLLLQLLLLQLLLLQLLCLHLLELLLPEHLLLLQHGRLLLCSLRLPAKLRWHGV